MLLSVAMDHQELSGDSQNKDYMSRDHAKSASDESCSAASLCHWWATPPGAETRGRASTIKYSPKLAASITSVKSDVTFEGGTSWNNVVNNFAQSSASGTHLCQGEKMKHSSNEASSERTASSQIDNVQTLEVINGDAVECQSSVESHNREKTSRLTEDRKAMAISDVFEAVPPIADEVELQWRISELRVALRASESARLESERETHALCKYLAEVEAAAASLQSQVQELEHLILFSSKDEAKDLDHLRKKMAVEASQEARNHGATAAQAVVAAREATMELDRVKRHASSLIKAQEEEIIRLSMEAAECRTLSHARAAELQVMKDEIQKLKQNAKHQSKNADDALLASQEEVTELRNKLDAAKVASEEKLAQYADLLDAYQFTKEAAKAAENSLEEVEKEKNELLSLKGYLEQQVVDLQNGDSTIVGSHYDCEIRKVRALLEGEKHHLLAELATLRHGNQALQGEVVQWREKFDALSRRIYGLDPVSVGHKSGLEGKKQPAITQNISADNVSEGESGFLSHQENSRQCKLCNLKITDKEASKVTSGFAEEQVDHRSTASTSRKCNSRANHRVNLDGDMHVNDGNSNAPVSEAGNMVGSKKDMNISMPVDDPESCQETSCLVLRDNLLTAAHKEIVKLKEINQCLVAACQNDFRSTKEWDVESIRNNGCAKK